MKDRKTAGINAQKMDYPRMLESIRERIAKSRVQAYRAANRELMSLYLFIGGEIAKRQNSEGWGKSVVERLSRDMQRMYPEMTGFSARNLWDMLKFYEEYGADAKLRQLVAEIPWGQNLLIMAKTKEPAQREYYLRATAEMGWSRNVLLHQIKSDAFGRHVTAGKQHNFEKALPVHLAEQADKAMKDVYMLDFLGVTKPLLERELEQRMVTRIRDVMLEFGRGFAFIGNQYRVSSGKKDYFIDLLFFHRGLRCLVAVELKAGSFEPEHAGKMNFYLNLLDDHVRENDENPSIGLILCAERDHVDVEYALRGIDKPLGVAQYDLTKTLPPQLAKMLPDAKDVAREIMKELGMKPARKSGRISPRPSATPEKSSPHPRSLPREGREETPLPSARSARKRSRR
jgi:predicted nuclease of restriction endonuclease-like (RecB) superfamily